MNLCDYFPVWNKLSAHHQSIIENTARFQTVKAGTVIHNGSSDCTGFLAVAKGQLRAYILSEDGREVTVYRLLDHDCCMFAASCMMSSLQFDIIIEAQKDTSLWVIPADVYKSIMYESLALANYTTELMGARFTEVMWLIEQIMWKSIDKRLAAYLLEESVLEDSDILRITHEKIANHMGSAREVITRMLRYFQSEGMVSLTRGSIQLTNKDKLESLAE